MQVVRLGSETALALRCRGDTEAGDDRQHENEAPYHCLTTVWP